MDDEHDYPTFQEVRLKHNISLEALSAAAGPSLSMDEIRLFDETGRANPYTADDLLFLLSELAGQHYTRDNVSADRRAASVGSHHAENGGDAMNGQLSPAICSLWKQQAQASTEVAEIWCDYAMMMAAFQSALERIPRTVEECQEIDIEHMFVSEIEHLADLVNALFPAGGMMEFADYVTGKHPERPLGEGAKSVVGAEPGQA